MSGGPMNTLPLAMTYAARELRTGLRGFGVFLACLALGVAAIGGVNAVAAGVLTALKAEGQAILGGDVSFRRMVQDFNAEEQRWIAERAVQDTNMAEMRAMAVTADRERRTLVELKAVDGAYPLYGSVVHDGGESLESALGFTDGSAGALVDAILLERLGVAIGDTVVLGDLSVTLNGILLVEPDRAAGNSFTLGPRILISRETLGATGLEVEGSLIYYTMKAALPTEVDQAGFGEEAAEAFPEAGWRFREFNDASPTLTRMVERLALFMTLVGLTALLVGGVGISNAVRAFLEGKLPTIATLKCLGAPNRMIFQIYLAQIAALAALGIGIGLLVAGVTPLLVAPLVTRLLPVPIVLELSLLPLFVAGTFGALIALAFTLIPLAQAGKLPAASLFRGRILPPSGWPDKRTVFSVAACLTALVALALVTAVDREFGAYVIAGMAGSFVAFRIVAAAGLWLARKLPRPKHAGLRLAVAGLTRPGTPAPSLVLSLGLGLTVLVTLGALETNLSNEVAGELPLNAPAFFFIDIQPDQIEEMEDLVTGVDGTEHWEAVPSLRGRLISSNDRPLGELLTDSEYGWLLRGDRGVTYRANPRESDTLLEGEWWPEDYDGPPLISIYKDIADAFRLEVGDELTVNVLGRDLSAEIASIREIDWDSLQINFTLVFSPGILEAAPHSFIATVASPEEQEPLILDEVGDRFANVTMVRVRDTLDSIARVVGQIGLAIRSAAGIALVAGALVLAGAIAAGHRRRVYDAVVLKVLGATRGTVLRAYLLEYGILGLATGTLAAILGGAAAWAVATMVLEIGFVIPYGTILTVLGLGLAVTLALGFVGTWRALTQKSAPLLRNE